MRALQLFNGNLLVPVEPGPTDDTGVDPFREVGPEHPEYGHWLALSTPGEDPRASMDILKVRIETLKKQIDREFEERAPGGEAV